MTSNIKLQAVYVPSENVVAREIEGELIIVPITSGVGDLDDELFTLNETGREIWNRLDGHTDLAGIIKSLASGYDAPEKEITSDVLGLIEELASRNIVIEKS
jgi:hypothetical protein